MLDDAERTARYQRVRAELEALLDGEDDWIAALATTACELHQAFPFPRGERHPG